MPRGVGKGGRIDFFENELVNGVVLPGFKLGAEVQGGAVVVFMVRKTQTKFIVREKNASLSRGAVVARHGRGDGRPQVSVQPVFFPEFGQCLVFRIKLRIVVHAAERLDVDCVVVLVFGGWANAIQQNVSKRKY